MPTPATRRLKFLRRFASLALALAIVAISATDAPAQLFAKHEARNRAFYGSVYFPHSYADSVGVRGHKRLENGGYYGPPQIYSRQYGTVAGYRTDPPFAPLRSFGQPNSAGLNY